MTNYSELLQQQPHYVMADGDGLIPLVSLLTPVFEEKNIGGVWVLNNVKHFNAIMNKHTMEIVDTIVRKLS